MPSLSLEAKDKIQSVLSLAVAEKRTPSLWFGATNTEEDLFIATEGTRVLGDPSSGELDDDSIFWVCSQTKLMVTIAALQLIEQGRLNLDTHVGNILPELASPLVLDGRKESGEPRLRPARSPILIRHLLNHTSGIVYEDERVEDPRGLTPSYLHTYQKGEDYKTFLSLYKEGDINGIFLKFDPGTDFGYGYSSDILGFIIEKVSGMSLENYFRKHIFTPLGIKHASFYLTPDLQSKLVSLVYRNKDQTLTQWNDQFAIIPMDFTQVNVHLPGIAFYMSQKEYLKLLRHLLQIRLGHLPRNAVLSKPSIDRMFEPSVMFEAGVKSLNTWLWGQNYQWTTGLCLNTADVPGKRRKGTVWWYGWAGTYFFMDPETGVAAILATQILPTLDNELGQVWDDVERTLYAGLI
ncbi:hypothetical protein AX16_005855 [Volvariella volvacea WC 439]|nr:hypothetical protein AX16_005855 [Volvariella volvacea WC 439]